MALNIHLPENTILKPEITVFGVGGAGGNATNNMIRENLEGVNFVVANTDAQAIANSMAEKRIQLGQMTTQGLGAGALPEIGRQAAEEAMDEILDHLRGSNMVFITAGMGGGTGTGAAPVVARAARELGILTVGVVTKPFHFEGPRRMKLAEEGLEALQKHVDTLIVIPNQNLFRIANEKTTFAEAFKLADNVLYRGVRGVTDLMIMPGLINLDFADVKSVMSEMGKAMMGTGEAEGERRAQEAAEAAISNPLLDNVSMNGARGVLINITGGSDMTLFEVDEAANRIREEVDPTANIIFGSTFNEELKGKIRVSVVATGIDVQPSKTPIRQPVKTQSSHYQPVKAEEQKELFEEASSPVAQNQNYTSEEDGVADNDAADEVAQNDSEEASDYGFAGVKASASASYAPANVDEEYYEAIRNLNEEYKAKLETATQGQEKRQEPVTKSDDLSFFTAAPVQPGQYTSSDIKSFVPESFDVQANDEDAQIYQADKEKTGLFKRMARGVGLGGKERAEYEEQVSQAGGAKGPRKADEDVMDIPAFLRRKA